jgi:hypothetical protein
MRTRGFSAPNLESSGTTCSKVLFRSYRSRGVLHNCSSRPRTLLTASSRTAIIREANS